MRMGEVGETWKHFLFKKFFIKFHGPENLFFKKKSLPEEFWADEANPPDNTWWNDGMMMLSEYHTQMILFMSENYDDW